MCRMGCDSLRAAWARPASHVVQSHPSLHHNFSVHLTPASIHACPVSFDAASHPASHPAPLITKPSLLDLIQPAAKYHLCDRRPARLPSLASSIWLRRLGVCPYVEQRIQTVSFSIALPIRDQS